jgi:hypothetical protein
MGSSNSSPNQLKNDEVNFVPAIQNKDNNSIFSFKVKSATGNYVPLSTFRKDNIKAYLIVTVGKQ